MAYVRTRPQQGQPCCQPHERQRLLTKPETSMKENISTKFYLGRIGLMVAIIAMVGTHKSFATAKINHRQLHHPVHFSSLRGGSSSDGNVPSGGGDEQLRDEELDEYIDFLLAYADDKVTEEDNPLFRDQASEAPLSEEEDEAVAMKESTDPDIDSISATDFDTLEPMVDDVDDVTQLDALVETLVASVDDDELEDEVNLEGDEDQTSATIVQESVEANEPDVETKDTNDVQELESTVEVKETIGIDEDVDDVAQDVTLEEEQAAEIEVESDAFYLGSSAVENMPLAVNESALVGSAEAGPEEITTVPKERVPLFTSFMQKIGLKKEDSEVADITLADSSEQAFEETAVTAEEDVEEDTKEGAAETTSEPTKGFPQFASMMQKIGLKKDDSNVAVTSIVDSSKIIEMATAVEGDDSESETMESGTSVVPGSATIDSDTPSPVITEVIDHNDLEEEAKETSETGIIAPVVDASAEIVDDAVNDQTAKTIVAFPVKQYYQGAWGSVKGFWSKSRWYNRGTKDTDSQPQRDYNKIYEKYFAAQHQTSSLDDPSSPKESSRIRRAFSKPWGTVANCLTPRETDDYSIGIKGFIAKDSTPETVTQLDAKATYEEVPSESEVITEANKEELLEDAQVIAESPEVIDTEVPREPEVITDNAIAESVNGEVLVEAKEEISGDAEVETTKSELLEETEFTSESGLVIEEVPAESDVVTDDIEIELVSEEVPAESVVMEESLEADVISEKAPVEREVLTEEIEAVAASEEVPVLTELTTDYGEADVGGEDILEDADATVGLSETEVIGESEPVEIEGTEVNTEEFQYGTEDVTEVEIEGAPVDLDHVTGVEATMEEIVKDTASITEIEVDGEAVQDLGVQSNEILQDSREAAEAEVEREEYLEDFEESTEVKDDVEQMLEIADEEFAETVAEINGIDVHDEEAIEKAEVVTEVITEIESDAEEGLEDTETATAGVNEDIVEAAIQITEVEEIEETSDDAEVETELILDDEENPIDVTEADGSVMNLEDGPEAVIDGIEARMNPEETLTDRDEGTPEQIPRRPKIFTRFWGKTQISNNVEKVVSDDEGTNSVVEETIAITEDAHRVTTEESGPKPNIFTRLWGTSKHPNDVYSLGLQGLPQVENTGIEVTEEFEDTGSVEDEGDNVDISVSIGIVEDDEPFDTLEISESSEVEDIEDDGNDLYVEIAERGKTYNIVDAGNASPAYLQTDRNVLQLHNFETQERGEETSLSEEPIMGATEDTVSLEDLFESDKVYTLQLHKEDTLIVGDEVSIEEDEETEVEEDANELVISSGDQYLESDEDETSIAEFDEIEDASVPNVTDGEDLIEPNDYETSIAEFDDVEDVTISIVTNGEDLIESDDDEISIAEFDDVEDASVSIATDGEDFTEDEDFIKQEKEDMNDVQEETHIQKSEEIILEETKVEESEDEVTEFSDNDIDEDEYLISHGAETAPYSWEVEMQNENFVSRFLVNKGLGQLLMIAIVVTEWFRVYIIAPFLDSIDWVKKGKGQDLLQSVMNTRGGAIASLPSESENDDETYEGKKIQNTEETEPSIEEESVEIDVTNKSEPDSSQEFDEEDSEQDDLVESDTKPTKTTPQDVPIQAPRKVPPNFIFRHLLNYGFVGHILIMEIILATEWFNLYVPQVRQIANLLKPEKKYGYISDEPENYMTSGFINIGEGSRLQKKSRKQKEKEDQRALDELRNVGDVNEAKYRFISQRFMKRHELGPYKVAVAEIKVDLKSSKNDVMEDEEAESDSGWILNALGVEKDDKDENSSSFLPNTSVGISTGRDGISASVGLEFNLGKKSRIKKSSSQSLRSVIVESSSTKTSSKHSKSPKPRVSDSESGIMGRLRAQGANSIVGRSILGAYPGDLPPPDEAADARGVIYIARRYGYGDWSEDEDEADVDSLGGDEYDENSMDDFDEIDNKEFRSKKRSARKPKRRRSSSYRKKDNVELGLSFDLGGSSRGQDSMQNLSQRKNVSLLSPSVATSSSPSGRRRRRKSRNSQFPSLAMETLKGGSRSRPASSKTKSTTTATKRKGGSTNVDIKDVLNNAAAETIKKRKTRAIRPAMSILEEKKKASDTKSQKDDQ